MLTVNGGICEYDTPEGAITDGADDDFDFF
jgi:hypothetical protein